MRLQDIDHAPVMRALAKRKRPLRGIVVHTAGTGVVERARETGAQPLDVALRAYARAGAVFPHAVIGQDGRIVQVAEWERIAWHAGLTDEQRKLYETGAWRQRVPLEALALWDARWPGRRGPLDIVPGPWNETTIGIELVPAGAAKYVGAGGVYARAQLAALRILLAALRERLGAGLVVVGHEDLEPLERWDAHGGWDPGALRAQPWLRWEEVLG